MAKQSNKKSVTSRASVSLPPKVAEDFELLIEYTRVTKSVYIREAVEDLLRKHGKALDEAKKWKAKRDKAT